MIEPMFMVFLFLCLDFAHWYDGFIESWNSVCLTGKKRFYLVAIPPTNHPCEKPLLYVYSKSKIYFHLPQKRVKLKITNGFLFHSLNFNEFLFSTIFTNFNTFPLCLYINRSFLLWSMFQIHHSHLHKYSNRN